MTVVVVTLQPLDKHLLALVHRMIAAEGGAFPPRRQVTSFDRRWSTRLPSDDDDDELCEYTENNISALQHIIKSFKIERTITSLRSSSGVATASASAYASALPPKNEIKQIKHNTNNK